MKRMEDTPLRYDKWVEEALGGVIRRALEWAVQHGLPGDHHFYITFRTGAPGIEIPDFLHSQYPEEMTIVLQHRFWDLKVTANAFEVTLSFRGAAERLRIPFAAVTAFADPSVNFGLQLRLAESEDAAAAGFSLHAAEPAGGTTEATPGEAAAEVEADAEAGDAQSGEVIPLDTFRKK